MADSEAETSNLPVGRDVDDRDVEHGDLPLNRTGATFDVPTNRAGADIASTNTGSDGETKHEECEEERIENCNYKTVSRWDYRKEEWKRYMGNPSRELPTARDFLYSQVPDADDNSVAYLIWGSGEDSLTTLHSSLQTYKTELAELQDRNSKQALELLPSDRIAMSLDESNQLNASAEALLEVQRLKEALKKAQEGQIKVQEALVKEREARVKDREGRVKESEGRIRAQEAHINAELGRIHAQHKDVRGLLSRLAEKGNETAGGTLSRYVDTNRVDKTPARAPSQMEQIRSAKGDPSFLEDLLKKKEIIAQKDNLCKLQDYVATILKNATEATAAAGKKKKKKKKKGNVDKRIKRFVEDILSWKSTTRVPSPTTIKKDYARPPPNGCETTADQPLLYALIVQILALLGQDTRSVSSERCVASAGAQRELEGIDSTVDKEYRDFLHVLVHEKLGRDIEVKPAGIRVKPVSETNYNEYQKDQQRAREQVIGHLATQLLFSFDFGGIGQNDVVCGVVLSMVSVQVLEMQLENVGTHDVGIVFRQTPLVPLFERFDVPEDKQSDWDMNSNGVLLLASAMLELPRTSMFTGSKETQDIFIDDESAREHYTRLGDMPGHGLAQVHSYLGSGSFAHVVTLKDKENEFIKFPRSPRLAKALIQECRILKELETASQPQQMHVQPQQTQVQPQQTQVQACFPRTMPWGVSKVKLSIRNEKSQMNLLHLTGIVGRSLGSYCKLYAEADCDLVIKKVHDALVWAHGNGIVHMDVRPSNIIVAPNGIDVLLTDWGCGMLANEKIKDGRFVGCTPYAHDKLLGARTNTLSPEPDFDFASLGFTWYYVNRGKLDWQFDRPKKVSHTQLRDRKKAMTVFIQQKNGSAVVAALVPNVWKIFG